MADNVYVSGVGGEIVNRSGSEDTYKHAIRLRGLFSKH